jgi:hypothetical protein
MKINNGFMKKIIYMLLVALTLVGIIYLPGTKPSLSDIRQTVGIFFSTQPMKDKKTVFSAELSFYNKLPHRSAEVYHLFMQQEHAWGDGLDKMIFYCSSH